jgi:hypothetical protein
MLVGLINSHGLSSISAIHDGFCDLNVSSIIVLVERIVVVSDGTLLLTLKVLLSFLFLTLYL